MLLDLTRAVIAAALLGGIATAQYTTVLPFNATSTAGNSGNLFPWGSDAYAFPGARVMACYDSANFTNAGITYPVLIQGIRWRADDTTATWTGATYPSATVRLGTAAVDYSAISMTWSNNTGPDFTVVHNGPVIVQPGTGNGVGVPGPYHVDVQFPSSPFLYDPSAGDLIIDTDFLSTSFPLNAVTAMDVDGTAAAMASRVFSTVSYPAATGTSQNHGIVVEVDFFPVNGLHAAFTASPAAGPIGMTANFTDDTRTSDPGGVLTWAWDLDGDSIIDSTVQNPSFTYNTCGVYDVTLTVTDASNPSSTLTRSGFIQVGITPMLASFTYSQVAPGVYQFTDTSTPAPVSWAWDFDGDGTTDSTAQHPTWTYTGPCTSVNVSLSASDGCTYPGTTTRPIIAAPLSATAVPFAGGNGTSSTPVVGNMFDVSVTAAEGINVCALEQGIHTLVGPFDVDVYVTEGTYIGKEANAAAWRLVASGGGYCTTAGGYYPATAYPVALDSPFYLPPGNYGIAIYLSQPAGPMYVTYTGGALGPYANGDITFFPDPATAPGRSNTGLFTGAGYTPRGWNGSFLYTKAGGNGDLAGYGFMGTGCAGSMGVSHLTPDAPPVLGTAMNVTIDNLPLNAAIMMTGFSNTNWPLGALPYDLVGYGAPSCYLRVSPDANRLILGAGNQAIWTFNTPNSPGMIGLHLFNQAIVLDTGFNAAGAVGSDAAGFMLGL